MQISSRFTIAIHMFACVEAFQGERKLTSDFLASSVNVNPVVIRRILQQLKGAGLVEVTRGSGGVALAKAPETVTLLDVYRAVECVEQEGLFRFHDHPNPCCPVGRNIHNILDGRLAQIQTVMEQEMAKTTLADVLKDTRLLLAQEAEAAPVPESKQ